MKRGGKIILVRAVERGTNLMWWLSLMVDFGQVLPWALLDNKYLFIKVKSMVLGSSYKFKLFYLDECLAQASFLFLKKSIWDSIEQGVLEPLCIEQAYSLLSSSWGCLSSARRRQAVLRALGFFRYVDLSN